MALSKEDIALFEELIADPSVPDEEKKIYKDALSQAKSSDEPKQEAKKTPAKAKPKTRKKTAKKPKEEDIEKAKAEILKRTGKTQEECEKIVDEYKALRRKATTRKKKETAQKEQAKKRTTKLKKEGKTIEGTTEKNVEATLETTTEKVVKKIDKEVDKIEKTSKTEKQVEKKLNSLVAKAVKQNKKLFSDTAKELRKANPTEAKRYLMSLRNEIDKLLKDYEYGGEVFDGSGDIVNYGGGGYTQPLNIQEGLISTGNNVQFAKGGKVEGTIEISEMEGNARKFIGFGIGSKKIKGKRFFPTLVAYSKDDVKNIVSYITEGDYYVYKINYYDKGRLDKEEIRGKLPEYVIYQEEIKFAKGGIMADGRFKILSKNPKNPRFPEIIERFNDYDSMRKYIKREGLTADDVFVTDNKEDRQIYPDELYEKEIPFAKGGKTEKFQTRYLLSDYGYRGKIGTEIEVVDISKETDLVYGIPKKELTKVQKEMLPFEYEIDDTSVLPVLAKGGKTQGYDDRLDDSLGMRRGRRSTKEQDYKDRRDESKGMEKGMGRRPYSSVGTMDMEDRMMLKKGGRLYDNLDIDEGAFTKEAEKRNMTTKEFMNKVLANKKRYSMKIQKQAQLMKNMGN